MRRKPRGLQELLKNKETRTHKAQDDQKKKTKTTTTTKNQTDWSQAHKDEKTGRYTVWNYEEDDR